MTDPANGPIGAGPYRGGTVVPHICIICFETWSEEPTECIRCRVPRSPISLDIVYQEMLTEAHRRIAAPRYHLLGEPLRYEDQTWGARRIPHQDAPKTPLEAMTPEALLRWLDPKKQ